ncbi:MAG: glutamine--scyllo-inositol aminotransferase, partial [Pseudanabaena sp.]
LSSLSMFEDKEVNVNSWNIPTRSINLPSYHDLNDDIERVVDVIRKTIS